jgi:hypothetical protein
MKKKILLFLILILSFSIISCSSSEPVETIGVEEAIENGTYELTDQDMGFRRDIDDILRKINLPERNTFSFARISDWNNGKRYYFEIEENDSYEPLIAYTENGVIVSIKSNELGYIYDISN